MLSNPQQMELLLYRVMPLIRLEWFFDLFEDRGLSVLEVFEQAVLIWFRPFVLLVGLSGVLHNEAQCILHYSLTSQELCKKLIRRW